MSTDFSCQSFGKWILAGEHAVLRGCPALVFPIRSRVLRLEYTKNSQTLLLQLAGEHGQDLQLLVWGVLQKACELKNINRSDLKGVLSIDSSIPVGAGMGASAALCVALTRWLGFLGYVAESEFYDFARNLENLFHGESSGVDIAVALSGEGLRFVRDGARVSLTPQWQPHWYISYTGERGVTLDAVNKVKQLIAHDPSLGSELDTAMLIAVELAQKSLLMTSEGIAEGNLRDHSGEISKNNSKNNSLLNSKVNSNESSKMISEERLSTMIRAIEFAGKCFDKWGLNDGAPARHMQWLREQGALAVKPTGSGGGGYVLSLWSSEPPVEVLKDLIPC